MPMDFGDNRSVSRELLREMAEQDPEFAAATMWANPQAPPAVKETALFKDHTEISIFTYLADREATPSQHEAIVRLYRSLPHLLCVATLGDVWRHFTQKPQ